MRVYFLIPCLLSFEISLANQTSPARADMLPWGSNEGVKRLVEADKVDFFALANNFEGQINKIFCGPASAAIVLNALRVRSGDSKVQLPTDESLVSREDKKNLPSGDWTPLFERYSQNNVFTKSPKSRARVLGEPTRDSAGKVKLNKKGKPSKDFGFQIRQFADMLKGHDLDVKLRVVDDKMSASRIKKELIANMKSANDYAIINYSRKVVGQPGGGHISPIGAYHAPSDSFLVLDVTPNKASWVWMKADLMVKAMRTFDTIENRGYVLVKEGRAPRS